jgi:hypothetical protein
MELESGRKLLEAGLNGDEEAEDFIERCFAGLRLM